MSIMGRMKPKKQGRQISAEEMRKRAAEAVESLLLSKPEIGTASSDLTALNVADLIKSAVNENRLAPFFKRVAEDFREIKAGVQEALYSQNLNARARLICDIQELGEDDNQGFCPVLMSITINDDSFITIVIPARAIGATTVFLGINQEMNQNKCLFFQPEWNEKFDDGSEQSLVSAAIAVRAFVLRALATDEAGFLFSVLSQFDDPR